ncbi:hypothetical protein [Nonomuraea sp. NPDC049480]|uniref:hypothetical protein n=1 Tax=Nonomuraea sp. NPDC049480 TaxID=3364353 RepID=UPI003787E518
MTVTAAAPAKAQSPLLLVGAALASVYVVWGSAYLAIRIMVEEMPPLVGGVIVVLAVAVVVRSEFQ